MKKVILTLFSLFLLHKFCLWTKPFGELLDFREYSQQVYDRDGRLLRLTIASDDHFRIRQTLDRLSPYSIKAALLYEDRFFYHHFGINPFSLTRALWSTFITKERVLGASTITMQLSRSIYHLNTRSIAGKLKQMAGAIWLEFNYSKDDILEAYLNFTPYGFNIEGLAAASQVYFNKPAGQLSLLEALTLTVMPQSPYERTKGIRKNGRLNKALASARKIILSQWLDRYPEYQKKQHLFDLKLSMRSPLDIPFLAPHFTTDLLTSHQHEKVLDTTIDIDIQNLFEKLTASHVKQNKNTGIYNAAAILLDASTMEILASVGSVDFFNQKIQGQVNGVLARRSPGSALKPFAYGLAMDQGIIHPHTMLKDAPTPFGTYTPDNFDRKFSGPLTATDALIHSRNIPAIHLAKEIKNPSLYDFLNSAEIPLNADPKHYGLSIVLGTAEVTMEELARLYSIFINHGKYKAIRKLKSTPLNEGYPLLTKESSFLIRHMLAKNPRPEGESEDRWRLNHQSIAWKTGTSVGFRDAWAVGIFDHYVAVVWVGNFSGNGNPAFVGREAAGPLLFSLIEGLAKVKKVEFSKEYPTHDLNLNEVTLCALSGQLPGADCQHHTKGWFIPGVSPIHKCNIHRRIEVDIASGRQVCPGYKGITQSKVFEYWPTDLLKLFKQAGVGRKLPPSLHPLCKKDRYRDIAPTIMSPKEDITYHLRTKGSDSKNIPLIAHGDGNTRFLTWYINGNKIGKSDVHQPLLWKAKSGSHLARVIDDQGRASSIKFNVNWID